MLDKMIRDAVQAEAERVEGFTRRQLGDVNAPSSNEYAALQKAAREALDAAMDAARAVSL